MGWLQLRLVATRDRVELLEDALLTAGALAVTLGDHRDAPILEPGVGETPLWPEVDLTALFERDTDRARVATVLGDTLGSSAPEQLAHAAFRTPEGKTVLLVLNENTVAQSFNISAGGKWLPAALPGGAVGTFEIF